jgi:predicted DCC family thiol-disulfide oxidoreductase YuxK
MNDTQVRWVLAFDASCASCWWLSRVVARASGGTLEVRSLVDPDVLRWRERAGAGTAWRPTLIMVTGANIAAWTGKAMAAKVIRHLGPRSAIRVLDALGQLRGPGARPSPARLGNAGARLL